MNFNTHRQRGSARIAVIAGAVALAILGITLASRPQTASAPLESRPVEQPSAPAYRSHLPEISPSAEVDNVYHYH